MADIIPDLKWLDAPKVPLKVAFAVASAASVLFSLDVWGVLDLGPLGAYTRPILTVISVFFWILTIVNVLDYLRARVRERRRQKTLSIRRAVRRREQEERREARRKTVLARHNHLFEEEIRQVADSLRKGVPTFCSHVASPPVTIMVGKELVWTPGGRHNQHHYPFSFRDFVWEALLARKDEFIARDEERKRAEEARKEADLRRGR